MVIKNQKLPSFLVKLEVYFSNRANNNVAHIDFYWCSQKITKLHAVWHGHDNCLWFTVRDSSTRVSLNLYTPKELITAVLSSLTFTCVLSWTNKHLLKHLLNLYLLKNYVSESVQNKINYGLIYIRRRSCTYIIVQFVSKILVHF